MEGQMWGVWIRRTVAWLVALYLARMYVTMGWVKFDPEGFWTAAWDRWGYPNWLKLLVGAIETGGRVLLLLPWTATDAAAALVTVMLGAGAIRFMDGRMVDVAWIGLYTLALIWVGFEWRGFRLGRRKQPAEDAS
jgi:uncharacterized membrane protein YphA (DoxX/SURF4 family)